MRVHLLVSGFMASFLLCSASAQSPNALPTDISRALECLVTASYVMDNLAAIGLRIGSEATVRYRIGSVPGTGKTPNLRWIAVYSKRGDRGWLLMADPDGKGGYVAVRNGYRITNHGSHWSADEGNGGLATYAAMSKWATSLANRQAFSVKLLPVHKGCTVDK